MIEVIGNSRRACHWEVVKMPPKARHSECFKTIHQRITAVIADYSPVAVSMEGAFFFKNAKTAMILGEVRGTAIAACALAELPVFEYSPRTAKQNITGWGAAPKDQVAKMVMSVLGLDAPPPPDAADALALALCHSQINRVYFPAEPI